MIRLLVQELKFRRNAMIGWGLGLTFFPFVYIGIYPSVAEEMAGLADLELYKAMGMNLGTFADWVGSILLIFLPLIAAIYAIINGTGTLAGEEDDGRLEMLVTLPFARWKIVAAKAIAHSISSFVVIVIAALASMGILKTIEGQIETQLTGPEIFVAVLSSWFIVFAVGMIAMFLAAFCSTRRIASMISAAILVIGYFGSNLSASTAALEPFEPFFLFTYIDSTGQAVYNGQATSDILVLVGVGLVSFVLTLFFFNRRRLTVGMWPWQKAKVEG